MNMQVLLHLCLTASSCIYSVPVASARVREQQELLHGGMSWEPRLAPAHPSRIRAAIGTASLVVRGWVTDEPGPSQEAQARIKGDGTRDKVAYAPGLGSVPEKQLGGQVSRDRSRYKYLWHTAQASLRHPGWTKPEVNVQKHVPGDASRDLVLCSELWQSVRFPIHPAYSPVTNRTVRAKEISPAHIKIVDWGKQTCLISLTRTPTHAPSARCSRAPFRLRPGHLVGFHHPGLARDLCPAQGSHRHRLVANSRSSPLLLLTDKKNTGLQHDVSN